MRTILVVDDAPNDREVAGACAEHHGLSPIYAETGQSALEILQTTNADYVLTGVHGRDGWAGTGRVIRSRHPRIPVILMTTDGSEGIADSGPSRGGDKLYPQARSPSRPRARCSSRFAPLPRRWADTNSCAACWSGANPATCYGDRRRLVPRPDLPPPGTPDPDRFLRRDGPNPDRHGPDRSPRQRPRSWQPGAGFLAPRAGRPQALAHAPYSTARVPVLRPPRSHHRHPGNRRSSVTSCGTKGPVSTPPHSPTRPTRPTCSGCPAAGSC